MIAARLMVESCVAAMYLPYFNSKCAYFASSLVQTLGVLEAFTSCFSVVTQVCVSLEEED